MTFRDCVATGNAGNAWDISVNTNHSIVFERCAAENCAGGYYMPLMPSGFCSGFNIQDELGARRQRAHKYWPNQSITGTGSVELRDCTASNLPGAAIQMRMGSARSSGDAVASTFSVRNFTASAVATLWDSPYSAYAMSGRQGFFPITFSQKDTKDAVVTTPGWMDPTVSARFEGVQIRHSNVGKASGRPVIGCQNFTALSSRSALLTPIPCEPTHLLRLRGSVSVQAANQSACDLHGLGAAAAELQVVCEDDAPRVVEPEPDPLDSQNVGRAERHGRVANGVKSDDDATELDSSATAAAGSRQPAIRIDQVGYQAGEQKLGWFLSDVPVKSLEYKLVQADSSRVVVSSPGIDVCHQWPSGKTRPPFKHVCVLDFTQVTQRGTYVLQAGSVSSPVFQIDTAERLFRPLLNNTLYFYSVQRDGEDVPRDRLQRLPSHLTDKQAILYETPVFSAEHAFNFSAAPSAAPVDVSGAWFDAGDFLKFVETASYTVVMMLSTLLRFAPKDEALRAEAKFGLDWLLRMFPKVDGQRTLIYQVGIGDGNCSGTDATTSRGRPCYSGDHDVWRLPEADDLLNITRDDRDDKQYFIKFRPAFRFGPPGTRISPNIAGRLAAAFAMCNELFTDSDNEFAKRCQSAAEDIYSLASDGTGQLNTTAPHGYYPESEWLSDMQMGALQMHRLELRQGVGSAAAEWLAEACDYASRYIADAGDGIGSFNLYDLGALAHFELVQTLRAVGSDLPAACAGLEAKALGNLEDGLSADLEHSRKTASVFGRACHDCGDFTPFVMGIAVSSRFHQLLTGSEKYSQMAAAQRHFVLGANSWGASFVVGAGQAFPWCLQHQVANLAGSLNGSGAVLLGGVVDGPSTDGPGSRRTSRRRGRAEAGDGDWWRDCKHDVYKDLGVEDLHYNDIIDAWWSTEPADDYTAMGLMLWAQLLASTADSEPFHMPGFKSDEIVSTARRSVNLTRSVPASPTSNKTVMVSTATPLI